MNKKFMRRFKSLFQSFQLFRALSFCRVIFKRWWKVAAGVLGIVLIAAGIYILLSKPKEAKASWWDDSWHYRKALVINHTQVTGDLTNFPILVSLTDSNLGAHAQADGDDIIFIDSTGAKLSHEIEKYASSTGELVAWVKIPTMSSSTDQVIYMYYGNASVSNQQDAENVWDNNYIMVQHLEETDIDGGTGDIKDSSKYAQDGTTKNMDTSDQVAGKTDGSFDFDGYNDYVGFDSADHDLIDIDPGESGTISFWMKAGTQSTTTFAYIFESACLGREFWVDTDGSLRTTFTTGTNCSSYTNYLVIASDSNYTDNNWHYVVTVVDRPNNSMELFIDGVSKGTDSPDNSANSSSNYERIATNWDDSKPYDGQMDEFRMSNTARSAAWIKTSYNNQNDPSAFLSVQAEETGPGPIGYWTFDEGHGTTAHDESGQGNDGTITGATWQDESMCVSGKCLSFHNTGDKVNNGNIDLNSTAVTVSWWMNLKSYSGLSTSDGLAPVIIDWMKGGAANYQDGTLLCYIKTNPTWSSGNYATNGVICTYSSSDSQLNDIGSNFSIELNKWYFVSYVIDGTNAKLYIDGNLENSITGAGNISPENEIFSINYRDWNYGTTTDGYIDEVKIYPYARTAEEIRQDYAAGLAGVKSRHGVSAAFGQKSQSWMSDGLVGYWKMDESATTTGAVDSSGNGNNGTYYGDASTTAGKFGNGGSFDDKGTTYINCGNNQSLNITGNEITLSAWIKFATSSPSHSLGIVSKNGYYGGYRMMINTNKLVELQITGQTYSLNSNSILTENNWYHIVGIYDGLKMKIFINGVEDKNTINRSGNIDATNNALWIGHGDQSTESWGYSFDGQIDEVRIYNRALSPDEVRKLYEWAPRPVAHWKFDEHVKGNGQQVVDSSGNSNNGTTTSANGTGMDCTKPGKYGTACDFDGVDDYVEVPSDSSIDDMGKFTIGAWMKLDNWAGAGDSYVSTVFGKTDSAGTDGVIGLFINCIDHRLQFKVDFDGGSDGEWYAPNNSISLNKWYYVAVAYDRTNTANDPKLYIDGIEQSLTEDTAPTGNYQSDAGGNIGIGARWSSGAYKFDGLIDDVRVYNYARTQKQILEDMNGGRPALKSPVLDLKFDEGYGGTAHDSNPVCRDLGSNCNNGTLYPGTGGSNTATSAMWALDGKFGKAMEFDGTDDYVTVPDSPDLRGNQDITISAWFNYQGTGYYKIITKSTDGSYKDWELSVNAANGAVGWESEVGDSGYSLSSALNIVSAHNWNYISGVLNKTNDDLRIYINGILVAEDTTFGNNSDSSTADVNIGRRPYSGGSLYFDGLIDDVKIYNYALTADEIKTEYNKGKATIMGSISMATSTSAQGQTIHVPTNAASSKYCVPGSSDYCAPPVGEWDFNEKTGTTAYDKSGHGNDGTLTNGPTWKGSGYCKLGNCLDFDGVDDYVEVGSIIGSDTAYTISAWFKTSTSAKERLYWEGSSSDSNNYIYISVNENVTGDIEYGTNGNTTWGGKSTGAENYNNGEWHHVVAVQRSTSDRELFVDGVSKGTDTTITNPPTLDGGEIGVKKNFEAPDGVNWFDGFIDDVRIYNYARTPAQIAWDFNRGKPLAEWKFDEGEGETIHDSAKSWNGGTANNGIIQLGVSGTIATGTVASSSDSFWYNGRNGKINHAGSFDGIDDYIDLGTSTSVANLDNYSIGGWFKADSSTSTEEKIYAEGNTGNNIPIIQIKINNGDIGGAFRAVQRDDANNSAGITYNGGLNDDTWHHFTFVRHSASSFELFIDGISRGTASQTIGTTTIDNVKIGTKERLDGLGDYFMGLIDDVKIWNYALTAEQVKTEYNNGAVSFGN